MNDRIKNKLSGQNSTTSVNEDSFVSIELLNSNKLLPPGELNRVIDVGEQFNKERQNTSCYRFLGTIKTLFTNVLFDVGGKDNSWSSFNDIKFRDRSLPKDNDVNDIEDFNYKESIDYFLIEENGWFGFKDPDQFNPTPCQLIDMSPRRNQFELTPQNGAKNWDVILTYPSSSAQTSGDITDGGLLIVDEKPAFAGRPMVALTTPVKHNLQPNDTVNIINPSSDYVAKGYTVIRLGHDNGDLEDYTFVIDPTPINSGVTAGTTTFLNGANTRMKKVVGGKESIYYYRKFSKITGPNDYDLYPLAFADNLYRDKTNQITFNKDIDFTDLRDNLGRPITEVFLTFIKKNGDGFTDIKSGIDVPYFLSATAPAMLEIGDIHRIHDDINNAFITNTTHTPLEINVQLNNTDFYGDVVEYNSFNVEEVILSDVNHRFNRVNREMGSIITNTGMSGASSTIQLGPRFEGYYYKPHHKIQIRNWSVFIEQGDTSTEGIPDYAEDLGDGRFLWRDLLTIGFDDGQPENVVYPFLNGCHYVYNNFCLNLKRQDPFSQYGLYYNEFPRDPFGSKVEDSKFITKIGNNVC